MDARAGQVEVEQRRNPCAGVARVGDHEDAPEEIDAAAVDVERHLARRRDLGMAADQADGAAVVPDDAARMVERAAERAQPEAARIGDAAVGVEQRAPGEGDGLARVLRPPGAGHAAVAVVDGAVGEAEAVGPVPEQHAVVEAVQRRSRGDGRGSTAPACRSGRTGRRRCPGCGPARSARSPRRRASRARIAARRAPPHRPPWRRDRSPAAWRRVPPAGGPDRRARRRRRPSAPRAWPRSRPETAAAAGRAATRRARPGAADDWRAGSRPRPDRGR